jgi:hypothetical protein
MGRASPRPAARPTQKTPRFQAFSAPAPKRPPNRNTNGLTKTFKPPIHASPPPSPLAIRLPPSPIDKFSS